MKKLLSLVSSIVLLVALFLTGIIANAQSVKPPETGPLTPPPHFPEFGPNTLMQTQPAVETASVQLGQPGVSFRYVGIFGVTEEPYLADVDHLNGPAGLFVDADDQIYVTEGVGHRLLRFTKNGDNNLILGHAGLPFHHDDFMASPKDIAVDSNGNIWVVFNFTVKKFSPLGEPLLTIPAENPWESGNDDYHFNEPFGIAFDQAGRLFVSDNNNHRIQVYDVSGENPAYLFTIGVTGEPKTDNSGFNHPFRIAFDNLNRLYVVDGENYRVQRCTQNSGLPETWSCTPFYGVTGEVGNDLNHLEYARGIAITMAAVYIADSNNFRVLKCDFDGQCQHFAGSQNRERGSTNALFYWPEDVAVDSEGKVYVSDWDNHRVQKFDADGNLLATLGVTRVPYLTDTQHINTPYGIAVAPDGSLYVTESEGYRVLKLNASGNQIWAKGEAGIYAMNQLDFNHYGSFWIGLNGNPGVDSQGKLYLADPAHDRILIYSPDGNFTKGLFNYGDTPRSIAVNPSDDRFAVAFTDEHVVKVYSSEGDNYIYTIGGSQQPGSDDLHLNEPVGVAFSQDGTLFIADAGNHRVMECIWNESRYWCRTFLGESGISGDDFGHFGHPLAVAVDAANRIYVADEWNDRVQVFNSQGAYLTTIGGQWGANSGNLRGPSGVAVDAQGNVYVTDRLNHRIQKYALGVPGWKQVNLNGFGEVRQAILSLVAYDGYLYAGTYNPEGAQIWRMDAEGRWSKVIEAGFDNPQNVGIDHMLEFKGCLYAGTWNGSSGGELWRTCNGTDWSKVVANGFGNPGNGEIIRLGVYQDQIYAATWSYTPEHGTELWRSPNGDPDSWERVVENGFGHPSNFTILALEDFNGVFFAAVAGSLESQNDGAEIWRYDGTTWVNITPTVLVGNEKMVTLRAFNGYLYAGFGYSPEIWRCSQVSACDQPEDWEQVIDQGFGNPNNTRIDGFQVFEGRLYAIVVNYIQGLEIWSSHDGVEWIPLTQGGFGNSQNSSSYLGSASAVYQSSLYIGTSNFAWANGGQIWQALHTVYLPLVRR